MSTLFVVNGEEKSLELRDHRGIDWSGDFIGNTVHGMTSDEEGRYIASPEEYQWWQDMITNWKKMEDIMVDYIKRFGTDPVTEVVNNVTDGTDLETQPARIIEALKDNFGVLLTPPAIPEMDQDQIEEELRQLAELPDGEEVEHPDTQFSDYPLK